MIRFVVELAALVEKDFDHRSLTGGRDNGAPGLREDYGENYFAAFVIDPDDYRLEAYCSKAE